MQRKLFEWEDYSANYQSGELSLPLSKGSAATPFSCKPDAGKAVPTTAQQPARKADVCMMLS